MSVLITDVLLILLRVIRFLLWPIIALKYSNTSRRLPECNDPLLKLSATELARKIRSGNITSQEVVRAYIQRIREVNPIINAVVEDRFEDALKDAKLCDEALRTQTVNASLIEATKPLYGVPITVKESCSLKGLSYTGGSIQRKGIKAPEDGAAVKILRDAGAIPLLVSNTAERCTSFHSFNYLYGSTVNPHNVTKTSGGSSGGEAAIIGAGASVLGVGSDLAGSIRIPALFTGIFGHKPTPGIVPVTGHFPMSPDKNFQTLLTIGPMARCVEDLQLAMKVWSSKCERPLHFDDPVNLETLTVFYWHDMNSFCGLRAATSEMKEAVGKVTNYLAGNGAKLNLLSQEWLADFHYITMSQFGSVKFPNLLGADEPQAKHNAPWEFIKSIVGLSQYTTSLIFMQLLLNTKGAMSSANIKHYQNRQEALRKKYGELLKGNTVLICPTFHRVANFPELMFFESDCSAYSAFVNMLRLPSTQVPIGLNTDKLPIGVQIISAPYQDNICLAVAKEIESAFGGWTPPC